MEGSNRTVGSHGDKTQRWIIRSIAVVDVFDVVDVGYEVDVVDVVLARQCFSFQAEYASRYKTPISMHSRISICGSDRPSVVQSVDQSVGPFVTFFFK